MSSTTKKNEAVEVVRHIEAPAISVFNAFTDPEQLVRWIGPGGPEATRVNIDPESGTTDVWIDRDEGEKHHFHWEVVESDPPERLVLDFAFGPPIGLTLTDERSRLTVAVAENVAGSSELTLTHERLTAEQAEGVTGGWRTITGRLAEYLEGKEAA